MARITALMITTVTAWLMKSKAESEIVPDSSAENTDSEGADSVE